MANLQYLSLPAAAAGLAPASGGTAWTYGSYVEATASTSTGIYITGIQIGIETNPAAADATNQILIEVATGAGGAEVTKLQVPFDYRADTITSANNGLGYWMPRILTQFFPEPYFVPLGTRIAVRATDQKAGAVTYRIKLLYREGQPPTVALNTPADSATGISTTPTLNFTGTDIDKDTLEYHVQVYREMATDDFNRANNSSTGMNLGVNWTATVPNSDLGIISNQAYQTANTGDNAAFYSNVTLANDQYAQMTLSTYGDSYTGLIIRANATDYVVAQGNRGASQINMYWYNSGTYTQIGSTYSGDFTSGDVIRLEAIGSTFTVYQNGVARVSGSNGSAPSSGKAGILLDLDTDRVDNFSCGDIIANAYSASDAGFTAGHPFTSGVAKDYTLQTTLSNSTTYYWRARAIDPTGTNTYSNWTTAKSFTTRPKSVALTGTITSSATETDIVAGGKTIILTLTDDTWVTAGATFDGQRANIIAGLTSAQSELLGWNNVVKVLQGVSGVVRTSATVVTITLDAQATYNITAQETITVTVPSTALTGAGALVASPTFTVDIAGGGGSTFAGYIGGGWF